MASEMACDPGSGTVFKTVSRATSLALLFLFGFVLPLSAQEGEPVLVAQPGLCILQRADVDACVMAVDLSWNSPEENNYCLYSSVSVEPLRCWDEVVEGLFHDELSSRVDVQYWLQLNPSVAHLAQINVRVVSLAQRNPERRRRRHVWSVL